MNKAFTGAFIAAACILLTSTSGANAQGYVDQSQTLGDVFQSGKLIQNKGSNAQTKCWNWLTHSWDVPKHGWYVDGDIFSIGTDEFGAAKTADSSYNDDPTDPFYYGVVREGQILIGYTEASPLLAFLQGATNGTIGPQGIDATYVTGVNTASRVRRRVTSTWKNNPKQPRWELNRLPLRVYIGGTVEAARGGLVRDTIKSALSEWARASNGVIRYQITSKFTESDIYFVEQLTDDHEWAQTCVDYHKGPIDRVKVILLESTLHKLEEPRLKGLCLHEIGHAFGILKHSTNSRDAMSEMATDDNHPVVMLSQRDRGNIAALDARKTVPMNIFAPIPIASTGD